MTNILEMSPVWIVEISRIIEFIAVSILLTPVDMGTNSLFVCLSSYLFHFFSLKPLDVQFMKELHNLVNIIPVIAKADTLTPSEVKKLKTKVS